MKQTGICLWMMIKRMGKYPVYWGLLLLFPAALFIVPELNRAVDEERILVGYVIEETDGDDTKEEGQAAAGSGTEKEREAAAGSGAKGERQAKQAAAGSIAYKGAETGKKSYSRQLLDGIEYKLREEAEQITGISEGTEATEENMPGVTAAAGRRKLFKYIKYTDLAEMKEDILTGEVSCGAVFDKEFAEKVQRQDYWHCVTLYVPEGMNVGGMVQEDIFARIYQAYSALWYAELLEQQGYQIKPEEVLQKFSEYQKEGRVFAVSYEELGKMDEGIQNTAGNGRNISNVLSLRGVLAFLTLLSASLGAVDGSRDRKRGVGKGISCRRSLAACAVGAPVLPAVLLLVCGMLFTHINMTNVSCAGAEKPAYMAWIITEIGSAFLYGIALWLSAVFFSRLLPEKLLEGIMPCFLLLVLLCCPIFFDLGETVPFIDHLSKLFPVTWYLEFWG